MPNLITNSTSYFSIPFRKKKYNYEVNPPNEIYNVTYLGNVLTIMGKGDVSVDKPLNIIWQTYNTKKLKRNISMKLSITKSGLKADTKQGLTEYWAHRVTYCTAPEQYPRLFCWVYKHEGKHMKPELRCHAVLCRKFSEPSTISSLLNQSLQNALLEYKREKLTIEQSRKNSLNGGLRPRRKIILQTGSLNFRTPISRSKSAPRLGAIDEEDELNCTKYNEVFECSSFENESEEPFVDIDIRDIRSLNLFNNSETSGDSEYSASSLSDFDCKAASSVLKEDCFSKIEAPTKPSFMNDLLCQNEFSIANDLKTNLLYNKFQTMNSVHYPSDSLNHFV